MTSGRLGAAAAFYVTDRHGGFSASPYDSLNFANWVGDKDESVSENISKIGAACNSPLFVMNPRHGTDVLEVFGDELILKPADILITLQSNVALLIPSADCVSIAASARNKNFLIAAHVGWRGAAAGIAKKIINTCELYGVKPADLEIFLGPAICGDCYEVQLDVQGQVCEQLPKSVSNRAAFVGLDLRVGLEHYFASIGAFVQNNQPCTFESANFFSYRKEGITGRHGLVAGLNL